jgi:hypothetical protein
MSYSNISYPLMPPKLPKDINELAALRQRNNPHNEPVGIFTGRCAHCGSNDLWDDNLAYGCNKCGGLLGSN